MIWNSLSEPEADAGKKYVENAPIHQLAAFYDEKIAA